MENRYCRNCGIDPMPRDFLLWLWCRWDDESDYFLDLSSTVGKLPISLKQMEFSLKQFPKMMGQANYSAFNKWNNVWVAGLMEKNHQVIICRQTHLTQIHDGPLHWETAVAGFWPLSRTGWCWLISSLLNWFTCRGLRWCWRNVQAKFRRQGR